MATFVYILFLLSLSVIEGKVISGFIKESSGFEFLVPTPTTTNISPPLLFLLCNRIQGQILPHQGKFCYDYTYDKNVQPGSIEMELTGQDGQRNSQSGIDKTTLLMFDDEDTQWESIMHFKSTCSDKIQRAKGRLTANFRGGNRYEAGPLHVNQVPLSINHPSPLVPDRLTLTYSLFVCLFVCSTYGRGFGT